MKLSSDTIKLFERFDPIEFTRLTFDQNVARSSKIKNQPHSHPFCELYFLLCGEVDFSVENETSRLCADGESGAVVLTRGGELHIARVLKRKYDHAFLFFDKKCFPEFEGGSPFECFFERGRGEKNCFIPEADLWKRMTAIIDELTGLSEDQTSGREYREFGLIIELLGLTNDGWKKAFADKKIAPIEIDPSKSPIANNAASYIAQNFRTISGLAEIAEKCGVSQSYLSRVFRQEFGVCPSAYLRNQRLEYAKTLLLNGYDVTSTCFHSGFSDYSHFIQVFKNSEGMTPLVFQKNRGVIRNDSSNPE